MRKVISVVFVLLLLLSSLWAGATYWFGVKTEEQYQAMLHRASEAKQIKSLHFVSESYRRGFLVSKARTAVTVQHPAITAQEIAPIRFTLEHEIFHGPFPLGSRSPEGELQFKPLMAFIETRMVLDPDAQSKLKELFDKIPELASMRNYTLIHPDGRGEDHLIIPPFQYTYGDEDKVTVDWKGLFLQVDFAADLEKFTGLIRMPGLEVSAMDVDLKVQALQHAFNVHEGIRGLWLGEASFDIPNFDFVPKEGAEFHTVLLRGIKMSTTADASEENIRYLLAFEAAEILLDEIRYGPGVFRMEIRNLDAASMVRLQGTVSQAETTTSLYSPEELQNKLLAEYLEILPGLLKKSPELEIIRMDLKTPYGDFMGRGKLAVDGMKWDSNPNFSKLPTALTADFEFKAGEDLVKRVLSNIIKDQILAQGANGVGKGLVEGAVDALASGMAEEQLQALTVQNVLVVENGSYKARASYNAGQIVLNDRPLQIQDFVK